MISAFTFSTMPRLIVGPGTIGSLGAIAASYGQNALLVTGSEALERSGKLSLMLGDLKTVGMHVHQCRIAGEPPARRGAPRSPSENFRAGEFPMV